MTPERMAELKAIPCPGWPTIPHVARVAIRELVLALEVERARLDWLIRWIEEPEEKALGPIDGSPEKHLTLWREWIDDERASEKGAAS